MSRINAKEAIDRIKKLLFTDTAPASGGKTGDNQPGTATYYLKDGTPLQVTGPLQPGSRIEIAGTEGTEPAPDGELELADGTVVSISGGIIAAIESASEENAGQADGNTAEEAQFQKDTLLQNKIGELEAELKAVKTFFGKHEAAQKQLIELVSQLAEWPAENPVARPKNIFEEAQSRNDFHVKQLADTLQKLKK